MARAIWQPMLLTLVCAGGGALLLRMPFEHALVLCALGMTAALTVVRQHMPSHTVASHPDSTESTSEITRQFTELRVSEAANRALLDIAQTMVGTLTLNTILKRIPEALRTVLDYSSFGLYWVDTPAGVLRPAMLEQAGWLGEAGLEACIPITQGIAGSIAEKGEGELINNAHLDPRTYYPPGAQIAEEHLIALPLRTHDMTFGVFLLSRTSEPLFTKAEFELVQLFVSYASLAIANARLYEQSLVARERLATLNQAMWEISVRSLDTAQLYSAIHQIVGRLMAAEALIVTLIDDDRVTAQDVYISDKHSTWTGEPYPIKQSFLEAMLIRDQSLCVNDFAAINREVLYKPVQIEAAQSGIAVLLRGHKRVLGMLFTQSYTRGRYNDEDVELLELLAAHVTAALENAALFAAVERLATTDALTGMLNRRHFLALAANEMVRAHRYNRPLSVILLDIDNFKYINDIYGHLTGDQVLHNMAGACRQAMRSMDLIGRYGGEEFIILVPETAQDGAAQTAERLRQVIAEQRFSTNQGTLQVTASFGVATCTLNGDLDFERLIERADHALYTAKRTGKNRVVVSNPQPSQAQHIL